MRAVGSSAVFQQRSTARNLKAALSRADAEGRMHAMRRRCTRAWTSMISHWLFLIGEARDKWHLFDCASLAHTKPAVACLRAYAVCRWQGRSEFSLANAPCQVTRIGCTFNPGDAARASDAPRRVRAVALD